MKYMTLLLLAVIGLVALLSPASAQSPCPAKSSDNGSYVENGLVVICSPYQHAGSEEIPFQRVGDPNGFFTAKQGRFFDKAFWYYQPNLNDKDPSAGWVRIAITDDRNHRRETLCLRIDYLTEAREIFDTINWCVYTQPQRGWAAHWPRNSTTEHWAPVKTVRLTAYWKEGM